MGFYDGPYYSPYTARMSFLALPGILTIAQMGPSLCLSRAISRAEACQGGLAICQQAPLPKTLRGLEWSGFTALPDFQQTDRHYGRSFEEESGLPEASRSKFSGAPWFRAFANVRRQEGRRGCTSWESRL